MFKTLILATSLVFNSNYETKNSNEFSQQPQEHIANVKLIEQMKRKWYEDNKSRFESKEHICKVWLTESALNEQGIQASPQDLTKECLQKKGLFEQCDYVKTHSPHFPIGPGTWSNPESGPRICQEVYYDPKYTNKVCKVIPGSPKPPYEIDDGVKKPGLYRLEYLDCPDKVLYPWPDNQPIKIEVKEQNKTKTLTEKEVESNQYLDEAIQIINSGDRKITCNQAMKALNKAIEINNANYLAHYSKGTCFQDIGQEDKAINSLKETLIHQPNYQAASYYLNQSYMRLKQYDDVIAVANNALRSSDNEQVPIWSGNTISLYCVADHGYIYNQKGKALYNLKKYNKAFTAFSCAAGLKVPGAYKNKGWSRLYANTGGDFENYSCDGFCKNNVCQDWESETDPNEKKCTFRKQCIPTENGPMGRDCWIWPE